MSSDWPLVSVKDVCDLIVDCVNKTAPTVDRVTPFRMIRTTNVRNGRIDLSECRYVEEKTFESWTRRSRLQAGDVILTREAPIGQVGIITENEGVFLGQRLMQYRANKDVIDSQYLLYCFLSPLMQHQFLSHEGSGSVVSHIRVGDCFNFKLRLPPLNTQREIASVLAALDDRITLLRETNQTLESIAQAIFKSWFVDFDPVRAKSEGRVPEGIDEDTAALFSNSFEMSELGEIPRGWEIKTIDDVVDTFGGATPDTKNVEYWEPGEYSWSSPKDLSKISSPILLETEKKVSSAGLAKISSGLLPPGTLLLSSRAPIGYLAIAETATAINQGYIAIPPGGKLSPLYMLFWCKLNMDVIKGRANGSTFMEISKKAFRPISLVKPPELIVRAFDEIVASLFSRLTENERQIRSLSSIRDSLLPRLISGQLILPDAEAEIEAPTA